MYTFLHPLKKILEKRNREGGGVEKNRKRDRDGQAEKQTDRDKNRGRSKKRKREEFIDKIVTF